MPILNLNGIKKIYYGNQAIKRLYLGGRKLWEGRRTVTGKFFTNSSFYAPNGQTIFSLNTLEFRKTGYNLQDVTHYIGRSGKEYPITLSYTAFFAKVPQGEAFAPHENHTLILKD